MAEKLDINKLVNERIKFYADLSTEPNVLFDKFQVIKHKDFDFPFIHLVYQFGQGGIFTDQNEIEYFDPNNGWLRIDNQMSKEQLEQFHKDCSETDFDVSKVYIYES